MPENSRFFNAVPAPARKSLTAIAPRFAGLFTVALVAALLTGCNADDNAGRANRSAPADQSNQSDGHMGDDNQGTGTMHDGNGDANRNGEMMPQGRGSDGRYMDTMRHRGRGHRGRRM